MSATPASRRILYSGRVQGVGFRYTARKAARCYDVTGFVRNLPDGRVEIVVEGEERELDRFLKDIAESMSRYIESQEPQPSTPTGKYHRFDIAH